MNQLQPSDVFVPGRYPVYDDNAYAYRTDRQDQFRSALRRRFVPILYGGYGVGKSSMALRIAREDFSDHKLVYIESVSDVTVGDFRARLMYEINAPTSVETIVTDTSERALDGEAGASADLSLFQRVGFWVKTKVSFRRQRQNRRQARYDYPSLDDIEVVRRYDKKPTLLVVDEMHKASDDFFAWFSQFLKKYSNSQPTNFRIAVLGTSSDPTKLANRDFGIDRTISEVKLDSFSEAESIKLITLGFEKLKLTISAGDTNRLTKVCVGSPFILQFLCLSAAEYCFENTLSDVTDQALDRAIRDYSETKAQRMVHLYKTASETLGSIRYRKQVLDAMAAIEDEYVTMDKLVAQIEIQVGQPVQSTAVSGPLRELKSEKYGSILKDIEYPGAKRVHNYSAFTDPAMKFIIRWMKHSESALEDRQAT